MAKKVRFPLEMENGIEVRTVDELKEHFSIVHVLNYLKNGKLVTWLNDRYEYDLAESVENLDLNDTQLVKKACDIFGVSYDDFNTSSAEREMKLDRLKKYTTDKEYLAKVDQVAFDQDDLYDLLDEYVDEIYLCGEKFTIPLGKRGVSYIGINQPVVVINSQEIVNWEEKKISLKGVCFDSRYEELLSRNADESDAYSEDRYGNNIDTELSIEEKIENTIRSISYAKENPSAMQIAKYNTIIKKINEALIHPDEIGVIEDPFSDGITTGYMDYDKDNLDMLHINTKLLLLYDYLSVNSYAKSIMENSRLFFKGDLGLFCKRDIWALEKYSEDIYAFKDESVKVKAINLLSDSFDSSENIKTGVSCKFIFWALMVLTVDHTDLENHASEIAELVEMFHITDEELSDILYVIRVLYGKSKFSEEGFKTVTIPKLFTKVCKIRI